MSSDLVTAAHLGWRAVVYVRQSTPHQVLTNRESTRLQYALRQRARSLGWREADIEVIDADLGLSGASTAGRQGFKDLVARVALGEVGLILSIEVTRLARNCSDWYPLLDLCGRHGCLIGDRDGLYDPALPDGRLVLGLKGTISEMELHTIRARLTGGLLAKAGRGELALALPTGLVRGPSGVVVQDPDAEVRSRIGLVFGSFLRLRTAVKVTRLLRDRALSLPRRDRAGDVLWRVPTIAAVTAILRNPAYAGAFVYGRTRLGPTGPNGRQKQRRRSPTEWRIVVKDRYPAYVSWPTFEKVQAMLADNHADYTRLHGGRGVPREGAALLHGILWCGVCGHKMRVRYKGGSQYVCNYMLAKGAVHEACIRAAPVDERVAGAFLDAVTPAEVEALARAERLSRDADEELRRGEAQQVERLRYAAHLAERQFNRVDPDNRLVAAELERRWEEALLALRRAEEAFAAPPVACGGNRLDSTLRARVGALGGVLRRLWDDPATPSATRKAMVCCLVDQVILVRQAEDRVAARVIWRGGAVTELDVALPVRALARLGREGEMRERFVALARSGLPDEEIAATLAAEGHRSPRLTTGVHRNTVAAIRRGAGVPATPIRRRWPQRPGWLTVKATARAAGLSECWIRERLQDGSLATLHEASGRHLFPDDRATCDALRQFRAGAVRTLDLRPHNPHDTGHQNA
jgi:DNA invertase Pin-like site-specific DNA recombinase